MTNETNNSADHLASAGGVEVVAWCIESTNSADWCWSATLEGVKQNATLLDKDCTPGEPFAVVRQSAHLAALSKEREVADGLAEAVDEVVSFIVGELPSLGYLPDNNRTRAALGKLRAALTAHRGSRSEGKEAGHGNG